MKILHVNKFFDLHGGAEIYLHDLMHAQKQAGHEVHALATLAPQNLPSKDKKYFVKRYDLHEFKGCSKAAAITAVNFVWNQQAKQSMQRALKELQPDVVHLHNIYHHLSTSILAPIRQSGVRCVQTLHDLKLACPNYRMYTEGSICERCKGGRYFEAVKHHCLAESFWPNALAAGEMAWTKLWQSYERAVQVFICPSEFMQNKMVEWGEPASKFKVLRLPVEMRQPAHRGGGYVLAAGRLSTEKGYDLLIRAAARVPALNFKIAGRGSLQVELQFLIHKLGAKNVELVGFKRGLDLANLYRKAEAFVACPIGYENSPLTVLDALGYSLPVLATRIGGLPEMVHEGKNGYLAGRGNQDDWVRILKKFAALSSEDRGELAAASRVLAEQKFSDWKKHVQLLDEIYRAR